MYDAFGVQIVHPLCHLSSNVDQRVQFELCLIHVNVLVQAAALAPLRHNSQRRLTHAAHEQKDVAMASLLKHRHFVLERLQLSSRWSLHIQSLDCNRPVPVSCKGKQDNQIDDCSADSSHATHLCTRFQKNQNRFSVPSGSRWHRCSNLRPSESARVATRSYCSHRPIELADAASHASVCLSATLEWNVNDRSKFAWELDTWHWQGSSRHLPAMALGRC